jgi:hypothetical protein
LQGKNPAAETAVCNSFQNMRAPLAAAEKNTDSLTNIIFGNLHQFQLSIPASLQAYSEFRMNCRESQL